MLILNAVGLQIRPSGKYSLVKKALKDAIKFAVSK